MDEKNKNLVWSRMSQGIEQKQDQQEVYLPIEVQRLIHEFARPLTRPDWRVCRVSVSRMIDRVNQYTWFSFPFYIPMEFSLPELSLYERMCFAGLLKEH
jgi:hypothetical protein